MVLAAAEVIEAESGFRPSTNSHSDHSSKEKPQPACPSEMDAGAPQTIIELDGNREAAEIGGEVKCGAVVHELPEISADIEGRGYQRHGHIG